MCIVDFHETNHCTVRASYGLTEEYANNGIELNNRFGNDASVVILKNLSQVPDLTISRQPPRMPTFRCFARHQEMASEVINVHTTQRLAWCVHAQDYHLNKSPWISPIVFHPLFQDIQIARKESVKDMIFSRTYSTPRSLQGQGSKHDMSFNLNSHQESVRTRHDLRTPIIIPRDYTATDLEEEHRLLFREDVGIINLHHWHCLTSARGWPRQANMRWQDLKRPVDNLNVTISDMERWRRNIEEAISTGIVRLPNGSTQSLTIDTLGNMVESSILSPNQELYGSLHNNGHSFSAYVHDPEHRYLESFGVIADEATTMRDPLFYRWHAWIDDLFQSFKETMERVRPYTNSELENPGVNVTSVAVEPAGGSGQTNVLNTYWMMSDVDLSSGLDFSNRGSVFARFTHLNNRPFRLKAGENTITPVYAVIGDHSLSKPSVIYRSKEAIRRTRSSPNSTSVCGWPQHMLIPKGRPTGWPELSCDEASSFCGLKDKLFGQASHGIPIRPALTHR
ncbi:Phenoloxidase subunit 2 [Eumeta japonica]|uniref:tyrosinase n=1 Tax=Eumeta variegata TaxID=151549 RepID=A0A4C2A226_EUMVA|nr:Phenoloxidase subunit 2 [Eumeta japonica]